MQEPADMEIVLDPLIYRLHYLLPHVAVEAMMHMNQARTVLSSANLLC